jgi:hypothetical protein
MQAFFLIQEQNPLRKRNAKNLEDLSPEQFNLADHAISYMIHIRTPVCLNNSTSFSFHLTGAVTSGVIKTDERTLTLKT